MIPLRFYTDRDLPKFSQSSFIFHQNNLRYSGCSNWKTTVLILWFVQFCVYHPWYPPKGRTEREQVPVYFKVTDGLGSTFLFSIGYVKVKAIVNSKGIVGEIRCTKRYGETKRDILLITHRGTKTLPYRMLISYTPMCFSIERTSYQNEFITRSLEWTFFIVYNIHKTSCLTNTHTHKLKNGPIYTVF